MHWDYSHSLRQILKELQYCVLEQLQESVIKHASYTSLEDVHNFVNPT